MGEVFKNWLNTNERRSYPLHDNCTRQAANGTLLPNDILVDASIWFPKSAGSNLVVSSVFVSPALITVTFAATNTDPLLSTPAPTFVPLAVVTVRRPHVPYQNYAVQAMYPGVGGWVTFGQCKEVSKVTCLFSNPAAAVMLDRTVHAFDDLPVISLGKSEIATRLMGIVKIKGVPGQVRTFATMERIGGQLVRVAAVGLDDTQLGKDILEEFAGTCGHRPEANNCLLPPIERINDVKPDCDGNINIIFNDPFFVGALQPGGLIVDNPISLASVCNQQNPFNAPQPGTGGYCVNDLPSLPGTPPKEQPPNSGPGSPQDPSWSSLSLSSSLHSSSHDCIDFAGPVGPVAAYAPFSRGFPPAVAGYDWSIERVSDVFWLATPFGSTNEEYMLDRHVQILLPIGALHVITATVRIIGGQANAAILFGHDGASAYGFHFFGITLERTDAHPNGKFVFGFRYPIPGEAPKPNGSLGLGWHYNPDESSNGFIYDPEVGLEPNVDYHVQLVITRSSRHTVIQPTVTWTDSYGVSHSFAPSLPFFMPVLVEGYAGFGGVSTDALFSHFGINC
jgi:hypothetical protein